MLMTRKRHSKKHVEEALQYAEKAGWLVVEERAHYAIIYCPERSRDGCRHSVNSSPKVQEDEARRIYRAVDRCSHKGGQRI